MSKPYFDGVKVGDTVYMWEKSFTVTRIASDGFNVESVGWFDYSGQYLGRLEFGKVCFWQPVPRPKIEAPPKPVEWVEDEVAIEAFSVSLGDPMTSKEAREFFVRTKNQLPPPTEARNVRIVFERLKREGE